MSDVGMAVVEAMRNYFGSDKRRINHALSVLRHAREIRVAEGGDEIVVDCAAALHDIGIHEAERRHGSSAGNWQEIEGPPVAGGILAELAVAFPADLNSERVEHILRIIANHHSARGIDTLEFRAVWDADWLVNIPDEFDLDDKERIEKLTASVFKTETGRRIAEKMFL